MIISILSKSIVYITTRWYQSCQKKNDRVLESEKQCIADSIYKGVFEIRSVFNLRPHTDKQHDVTGIPTVSFTGNILQIHGHYKDPYCQYHIPEDQIFHRGKLQNSA
jgi:hypothetical protein